MGLLVTALASAALAAPASAVEAPVIVPLEGLEPVLPMDAPTVATGVPVPMPGAPTGFQEGTGTLPGATVGNPMEAPRGDGLDGLPDLTLPRVGLLAPALSGALDSRLGLAPGGH
ncbi:hypothetical protein ACPCSP_14715 [Streptomyces cinereoruber]|uniref:hypothetical protein n=1 Tax=Streptomyces cinereoruber TaxID=67260 RepID=UPI003C30798E